ncbi:hypothetical protein SO802_018905 [Lithocarpus litseifolius]|uniref:Uncharacterized protein n=1 Tax=Lithocarpus litseifolius TaxID=425828 RepID=A0AAW2CPH2_9ROSI
MSLKKYILVRGRGFENKNKWIKDNAEETNLEKHRQNVLEKIQVTLCKCRKTIMDEDSENANMPLGNQEPRLKTQGNHRLENYRVGELCAYGLAVDLLAILWLQ